MGAGHGREGKGMEERGRAWEGGNIAGQKEDFGKPSQGQGQMGGNMAGLTPCVRESILRSSTSRAAEAVKNSKMI